MAVAWFPRQPPSGGSPLTQWPLLAQAVWKGVGMSTIVNATLASAIVGYRSEQNRLPDRSRRSLGHLLALI
jgi:hypothetical protein